MKKTTIYCVIVTLFAFGCVGPNNDIKKDLNTRFTKFEIVEIKPDSSNVYDAAMTYMSLGIKVSEAKLSMASAESEYYDKKRSSKNTMQLMDSVVAVITEECQYFFNLKDSRKEPCYYVKYRIFKDEIKVEKEEYYYIRPHGDGKVELMHRPYSWFDYLKAEDFTKLRSECIDIQIDFAKYLAGF
jgi:hypothetical protein